MNGYQVSRRHALRIGGFTTLSLAAGGLMASCGGGEKSGSGGDDALDAIRKRGFALFGFDGEKPFNYLDPSGDLVGSEIDIARYCFEKMGIPVVQGVAMNFDSLIPAIQANRIDTCMPIYVKPKRCEVLTYTTPHIREGEGLIVPSGNPQNIHSWDDISKNAEVKVGLLAGASTMDVVKAYKVDSSQITDFKDTTSMAAGLKAGRVNALVEATGTIRLMADDLSGDGFERVSDFATPTLDGKPLDFYAGFPFLKANSVLRDAMDAEVRKLVTDKKLLDINGKYGFTQDDQPAAGAPTLEDLCNAAS